MEISVEQRHQAINRVTLWGVLVNLLLSVTKLAGGFFGQSQALIADGLHSLSDLASDAMVFIAAKHASEEADAEHPYGHARYETIATVALASLLIIVGLGIAYDAIVSLVTDEPIAKPDIFTLWIAALSIVSNEGLYHYTRLVGTRIRSNLLLANAWHHRSDAVSSIVVLIGIAGTQLDMPKLDAYAAIVVALMIVRIGFKLGYDSVQELVDASVEPELVENIRQKILRHEGVRALHMLRTRRMGHQALVDVHILVAPRVSVSEGHHISETVEKMLIDSFDEINDVTVHIDPEDDEQEARSMHLPLRGELIRALKKQWSSIPELEAIDDITLHYLTGEINVEASIPLKHVGDLDVARTLQNRFHEACMKVPAVGRAVLKFH
ncbi:MAG: cation transporter [Gammaproteobacteria bacterium]|nr:cation diffusion facilitator family transporter [Gammaproteobacteria bacterium]NNJ97089.1 cation transporter [Gammaproteobacteria bacterium]